MQIKPRDYQNEALEALAKGRRNDIKRVVEETGLGAIFMAHRDELITQPAQKIPLVWPEATIGRVKANDNELGRQVTVASIQTIQRDSRLTQIIEAQEYSLLYIDEAHHATSTSYRKVIDAVSAANPNMTIVGLTATPVRSDATSMDKVFTEITYHKSMLDLIEAGYLSDIELKQVPLQVSIDGVPRQGGDLKSSEVRKILAIPEIMVSMVDAWKAHAAPRRTIVFAIDVAHANYLAQIFQSRGVKATSVYGDLDTTERRKRLAAFQSGEYDVLTNVGVLVEGFDDIAVNDAAPLSCIMLARPTLSQSLYIQSVGRGTRLAPDKENCLVLDFAYNSSRHHIVQLPHLFGMEDLPSPNAKKKIDEGEVIEVEHHIPSILAAVRDAQQVDIRKPPPRAGLRWAKSTNGFALSIGREHGFMLIRPTDKDPKLFEVFHLAPPKKDPDDDRAIPKSEDYAVHRLSQPLSFEWAFGLAEDSTRELHEARSQSKRMQKTRNLEKESGWMTLPPTDNQLRTLARTGEKPKNRGEATNMITALIVDRIIRDRKEHRTPATKKQLGWLRWKKIPIPKNISKSTAARMITDHKRKEEKKGQQELPID